MIIDNHEVKSGCRVVVWFGSDISVHEVIEVGNTCVKIKPKHSYLGRWIQERRIADILPPEPKKKPGKFSRLLHWFTHVPD